MTEMIVTKSNLTHAEYMTLGELCEKRRREMYLAAYGVAYRLYVEAHICGDPVPDSIRPRLKLFADALAVYDAAFTDFTKEDGRHA
jgi:hypothetical protein